MLENGVISYYDSEDDVGKGSKGSIKMSVCDIKGGAFFQISKWPDDSSFTVLFALTQYPRYSPPNRPNASGVDHPRRAALLRPSCERCRETEVVGGVRFFQSWNTGRSQTQGYTVCILLS